MHNGEVLIEGRYDYFDICRNVWFLKYPWSCAPFLPICAVLVTTEFLCYTGENWSWFFQNVASWFNLSKLEDESTKWREKGYS